jgi:FkbM family methyltransferase
LAISVLSLSDGTEAHTICGITVDFLADSHTEFRRFRNLVGERDVIREVLGCLEPADVFYDVGANVGMYTCFVASELGADRTVAFEPHKGNANRLMENLRHNGLDARVVPVALSNSKGTVDLAIAGEQVGEGKHAIATDDAMRTVKVDANRGDGLIDCCDLPEPTVVKIDVEGAEFAALEGLRSTLQQSCRLVFCEIHPEKLLDFGSDEEEIHQLLQSYGFETEVLHRRGQEYFIKAKRVDDAAII